MISALASSFSTDVLPEIGASQAIQLEQLAALAPPGVGTALLPDTVGVTLISTGAAGKSFALDQVSMSSARIDLGEGYLLSFDDRDRMVVLENTQTAGRTVIFGDGRMETPDGTPMQFWGTTSLRFGSDGKVTLQTVPVPDAINQFRLDKITVTSGTKAAVITGVADAAANSVTVKTSVNGYNLDSNTRDGFTLEETADGLGWTDELGQDLSQDLLDATAKGGDYGPGSKMLSLGEVSIFISRLFATLHFMNSIRMSTSQMAERLNEDDNNQDRTADRLQFERLALELAMSRKPAELVFPN